MNRQTFINLVHATKGKFFSITFLKADGSRRVANGKNFYRRLVKGGESTLKETNSVPFVDRNKEAFIAANGDRVIGFRCGSVSYGQ